MNTALGCNNCSNSDVSERFSNFNTENKNLKSISGSLLCFENVSPEDIEWSTELCSNNVFNNCNKVSENEIENKKRAIDDSHYTYKISTMDSCVYRSGDCKTFISENTSKIDREIGYNELPISENKCSEVALKCLYGGGKVLNCGDGTNSQRGIITFVENDIPEGGINHTENSPVDHHKIGLNSQLRDNPHDERPLLHAETISLITDGIIGQFSIKEPIFSNEERFYVQEQVVPTKSNVYENNYPGIHERSEGQYSTNYEPENEIIEEKEKQLKERKVLQNEQPKTKRKKILADFSPKELWAFTPAGQIHRLAKGRTFRQNTKVTANQKHLEIAVELNCYKKINQIQNGILVPEGLDFNKEEEFNCWFREEREKTEAVVRKFDVELNTRYLAAERELLRLDRKLKQYMLTNPTCALEELDLIETFDITLINLVYTSQVYETLFKVSKMLKKGNIMEKVKVMLEKLKALITPPQELKVEDYLMKLRLKEDIKLKPTAPTEWIIHLIHP